MFGDWLSGIRKYLLGTCVALALSAGTSWAGEEAELRTVLEQQQKQIEELKARLDANAQVTPAADGMVPKAEGTSRIVIDDGAIKKIVADYLKENPGAGMPASVQTGYSTSTGFAIRSTNNPAYVKWDDECKIPFELRIRGRLQLDYYGYKVTDNRNHLAGTYVYPNTTQNTGVNGTAATGNPTGIAHANSTGDFSQLEVKRMRLIFEGTAFDPNLRYHIQLDGGTRGLTNSATPFGPGVGIIAGGGGNGTVDHAMRLFSAYVAYDIKPCCSQKGCGADCGEGTYKYSPTLTLIAGKLKPFFAFEEMMGSANEQFVEFGMAEWFFDADDDNLLNWWGVQYKGFQDRLYAAVGVTNGNETQLPNLAMDRLPGFNGGFWFDFGGNWNEARHAYDLFGDSLSDLDYSCKPVVRVGGAFNCVWQDPRTLYGSAELGRQRVAWAPPGGTTLSGLLNGGNVAALGNGNVFQMDKNDEYTFEAFWAMKFRGFSLSNDWFCRFYDNFKGTHAPGGIHNPIVYTVAPVRTGVGAPVTNAVFTRGGMFDYGMQLQGGYFVIPKRLELAARWDFITGQSGNIYGDGRVTPGPTINGTRTAIIPNAFKEYHTSNEYSLGVNYYWRRQQFKWQTDLSAYQGGNPAAGGQSPAGFIPGVDGYMLRSQIQIFF